MVSKEPIVFYDNCIVLGSATFIEARNRKYTVNKRSETLALSKKMPYIDTQDLTSKLQKNAAKVHMAIG